MKRRNSRRESGQAAVETAIVMPLTVFLILGLLQLGLLHQARVMTKYAAYKAVRVGSIHNAKKSAMKRAALAVMLPFTGKRTNMGGGQGMFYKATMSGFPMAWAMAKGGVNKGDKSTDNPLRVTVCEPTKQPNGDFDDPDGDMGKSLDDWQAFGRGRLSVQVQQNQEMVIPFANAVIFYILVAQERAELYKVLRMRAGNDENHKQWLATRNTVNGEQRTINQYVSLASQGTYVLPIRASWSMRMMSNFLSTSDDFKLPTVNNCRIPWAAGSGGSVTKGKD